MAESAIPRRPLAFFAGSFAVFAGSHLSSSDGAEIVGAIAYFAIYLGFIVSLIRRSVVASKHRRAWITVSIGFAFNVSATLYEALTLSVGEVADFPSILDVGWVMIYPFGIATAVMMARVDHDSLSATTWFDGAITTLGLSAIVTGFALGVLIEARDVTGLAVFVAMIYPIGDALLIGLMAGSFTLGRRRPSPMWLTLLSGVAIYAITDLFYLADLSRGSLTPSDGVRVSWVLGVTTLALATWASPATEERAEDEAPSFAILALPMVFAVLSLTVITAGSFISVPGAATALAVITLGLVLVRTTFSFQQAKALGAARGEARTDDLTRLANRRLFYERLTERLDRREDGDSLSIVLLDLSRFKEINDVFGHETGDRILERIGIRISSAIRGTDFVARLNGDQFIVIVDGGLNNASAVAHRINNELSRPFDIDLVRTTIQGRFGLSTCPDHSETADRLVQQADKALLEAKAKQETIGIFTPGSDAEVLARAETLQDLRRDISTDAMVVHYQPKLDLATRKICGAEGLVRWQHPTRGLLFPDQFLDLIEQGGLMQLLTRNVLSTALRDAARWKEQGFEIVTSVNLSPSDLRTPNLAGWVRMLLAEHELDGSALQLELTEDVLVSDPELGRRVLTELRSLGVSVSIDDFGTGYSSLAYLEHLPVDELKLDRSFVMQLDSNEKSAPIVKSTIDLAHALGLSFVAEGVETEATLERLAIWGCDIAQGYHIGKPESFDAVTAKILDYESSESSIVSLSQ